MPSLPKHPRALRLWTVFLLVLLGGIALLLGMGSYFAERSLRARALPGEAVVIGFTRWISHRGSGYLGEPNALDLRYRDAGGKIHPATMLRAGNRDLTTGSRFAVIYDTEKPGRVRRAEREAEHGFHWALAGVGGAMLLLGLSLIPGLRRRMEAQPDGSAPEPDFIGPLPDGGVPQRFYALAGRPVMVTRTKDGGADLFAMERETGAFLPARDLWTRLREGSIDLDEIDEERFRQIGREWRRRAMEARTSRAVTWEETDSAEYPLRTLMDGHETRLRINDFPDEPLFSVIVAGQSVGELEDWPPAWRRP